jgi:hypothetical protein
MKTCPYCKNPIYEGVKRCIFCGRNLDLELARKLKMQRAAYERRVQAARVTFSSLSAVAFLAGVTIWAAIYSPFGSIAQQAATQTAVVSKFCDPSEVYRAAEQLIDYNDRWADIMALAVSVERDLVVVQVDRLQNIRRDTKDVNVPECMQDAKHSLIEGMDAHIEAMLAHIRAEPLETVNEVITQGNIGMNRFLDEAARLEKCAPVCR